MTRLALAALAVTSVGLVAGSGSPVGADVTQVRGGAFGAREVITAGPSQFEALAPTPVVSLGSPPDGLGPFEQTSPPVDGITSGPLQVSVQGGNLGTHAGFASARASLDGVLVGGAPENPVTASSVTSTCTSDGDGSRASTDMTGVSIFGVPVDGSSPGGSKTYRDPTNPSNFLLVSVWFNEQTRHDDVGATAITVTAVHINYARNIGPRLDVFLGQSSCEATGPDVNAPTTTTTTTVPPTVPTCGGRPATIVGTAGADVITGTPDADVIVGQGGSDSINGLGGDDLICGNGGDDRLGGGAGNDTIYGGGGADLIVGGRGDDRLVGETGDDDIHGDEGNDVMIGGRGRDILRGGPGNDRLSGGPGNDHLLGGPDADSCDGGSGTNALDACEPPPPPPPPGTQVAPQ